MFLSRRERNVCTKSKFGSGRRLVVTNAHFVHRRQTRDYCGIVSAIVNTLQFGTSNGRQHLVKLGLGLRLSFDVAVVVRITGHPEQIGSFCLWHVAGCATPVFNVEVAKHVQRMWFHVMRHGGLVG